MQVMKIVGLALIGASLAFAAAALFVLTMFEAPKLVARWIPASIAGKIGLQGVKLFASADPDCNEGAGAAALRRILDRLQSGADYGQPFKLHIVGGEMENSFALPGRHIVLVSGLIKRTNAPEEIAGVLAHEMGHGLEKDPEALFIRNIGMKILLKFLAWGDDSAAEFRAMLLQMRYSRDAERSADAHAIAILKRARISPEFAGDFIMRAAAQSPTGEGALDDFGAHPASEERARLFLSQPPYPAEPILTAAEWTAAQTICDESGLRGKSSG
jgi:Zn-dependent protease with chaperone function